MFLRCAPLRWLSHCRSVSLWRLLLGVLIAMVAMEFIVLNVVLVYVYRAVKHELEPMYDDNSGRRFIDALVNHPRVDSLLRSAKDGGFVSLLQDTIERAHVVSYPGERIARGPRVSFLGIDTSHSGEASYLFRRINEFRAFPFQCLMIDIGANDGFLSSNSFNFIQWGWSAILVEPQRAETIRIQRNLERYVDPYKDSNQTVTIVHAVLGDTDGIVQFALLDRTLGMESHVIGLRNQKGKAQMVEVQSFTVRTFASKYRVPRRFGILSIDAEGLGDVVLHQWIDGGYTPAYIVYENLHNKESLIDTNLFLIQHGYKYMTRRGWNNIYEHNDLHQ